jgi:hypothetical protein
MHNKLTRTLATTLLLAGTIGVAAQPGGRPDEANRPQKLDIAAAATRRWHR